MQDHEFYADPTVFDYWQARCSNVLCSYTRKLSPYGWTLAFAAMATLFALTAVTLFGWTLITRMGGEGSVAWNQSVAQMITIMMALLACQALLQQALRSWPPGFVMPQRLRHVVRLCGWEVPAAATPREARQAYRHSDARKVEVAAKQNPPGRDDIQAFFTGVRTAGVNVAIARALFSAGVRTPGQLCAASDEKLLAIHGVGFATVRKLRRHFDCH